MQKTEIKQETKTGSNTSSNSGSNNNSTKDSITTKTTTTTESIAFKTIRQNDSSLEKRKEVVAQNGQDGVRTITYKETYTNGKLTSKEQVSSKVTKNPVDKIIKVGTKEPQPTKLSVSEAHSILGGSGMTKSGDTYTLRLSDVTDVMVKVGSNGVSSITFNGASYIPWKGISKEEMIEIFGKEEGTKEYEWMKGQAAKIEKAVRAAANAVYSSGTSQANSLYNQIINSNSYSKSF
ncbi:G5 domain-containing protein [Ornithinibacillus sp. BX22]|uniref:G5 domain-containing protein n=1 Tax=Ornithinibacillus hominis TaxID=2763055 RepID=A0A923L4G3_9BACI|nr:G5 domain-containing protein [Ornithinibacillus hominis]